MSNETQEKLKPIIKKKLEESIEGLKELDVTCKGAVLDMLNTILGLDKTLELLNTKQE